MKNRKKQKMSENPEDKVLEEKMKQLDQHCLLNIAKYFNTIYDYINVEKCCKEYNGLMETYKYNPISFRNEKEREIFKNIETYHFYSREEINENIEKDIRIKEIVHWERVVKDRIIKDEKHKYKNVIDSKRIMNGECGNDATFELYENGSMFIDGFGNMNNYEWNWKYNSVNSPWDSKKENIKEINIKDGIKSGTKISINESVIRKKRR